MFKDNKVSQTTWANEWGVNDSDQITHISKVPSGMACQCRCPGCGDKLIAKKGEINSHHFSHESKAEIQYCSESVLHLVAKHVVAELSCIQLPERIVKIQLPKQQQVIEMPVAEPLYPIHEVKIESSRKDYRPDITLVGPSMAQLDVEILVTHEVDEKKAKKVKKAGIDMIEIDLSEYVGKSLSTAQLKNVISMGAKRKWIYRAYEFDTDELAGALSHHIQPLLNNIKKVCKEDFDRRLHERLESAHQTDMKLKEKNRELQKKIEVFATASSQQNWVVTGEGLYTIVGMKLVPGYSDLTKDMPLMSHLEVLRRYPDGIQGRTLNHVTLGHQPVRMDVEPRIIEELIEGGVELPIVARLGFSGVGFNGGKGVSYVNEVEPI